MTDDPDRVSSGDEGRRLLPWPRAKGMVAAIILAAAGIAIGFPLILFVSVIGWITLTACRGEEREAYEEFDQYSPRTPRDLDPRPGWGYVFALGGNCHVVFDTESNREEITDYYAENLRERGWKIEVEQPRAFSETTENRRPETTESEYSRVTAVSATRGQYSYRVRIFDESSLRDPPEKLRVAVTVRDS